MIASRKDFRLYLPAIDQYRQMILRRKNNNALLDGNDSAEDDDAGSVDDPRNLRCLPSLKEYYKAFWKLQPPPDSVLCRVALVFQL
jgi:hypothetical protein